MSLKYRADIDGLRAIAVLAVVFYHTDIPGFTGGFVGVDIFFVISGFLITTIILKEIKIEKFSIVRFYERRIRRIFPALFPVIAFVSIAGVYLFTTTGYLELCSSITSTTLFYSNIFFMLKSGYFEPQSLQRPLLHTWSLAVEEQFYVFFPLSMILINKFFKAKYFSCLLTIGIISLFVNIYGISHHPSATFYLVPTRAWELLAGSILALGLLPTPTNVLLRNALSITGISLIIYSVAFYTEATPFPGQNAIPPVLGAALILYSNLYEKKTTLSKLLSMKPLVFIGLISYSLYLWHWPFVAFANYSMFRPLNSLENVGIILASFVAATLSWRYIERPFRGKEMLIPDRKKLFAFSGILMFAVTGVCLLIQYNTDVDKTDEWADKPQMPQAFNVLAVTPTLGMDNVKPSFALWGDSHARALIPGMDDEAKLLKISGIILTHDGTPPLLGIDISTIPNNNPCNFFDEALFNNNALAFLKTHKEIKTVFLSARWAADTKGLSYKQENILTYILKDSYGEYTGNQSNKFLVKVGLTRTVHALLDLGRKVIIVNGVPEIGYNVPRFSIIKERLPIAVKGIDIRPTISEYDKRNREVQAILSELALLPNVTIIHPESKMFDENGVGKIIANEKLLYFDDNHLSSFGSHYVASTFHKPFKEIAGIPVN